MKKLFQGGKIVNVFTDTLECANVVVEDGIITGVGEYTPTPDSDYDEIIDCSNMILCPGFIDSHIHIESTMLTPAELSRILISHGTTAIIADPHEIANVCGIAGIEYMLESSASLPLSIYFMASSCVPAVPLDESATTLSAGELKPLYSNSRVLGLAEMMNFPGVLAGDSDIRMKISDAAENGGRVNGHAPLLLGESLDKYIVAGVEDDHECSDLAEAIEKLKKGMRIFIRQGSAARNLDALIDLFDAPYSYRCMLCTDDKSSADLISDGHIDSIIRAAADKGKSTLAAIRMATIQPAEYYGLKHTGAIAPGYNADIAIFSDLKSLHTEAVYKMGESVYDGNSVIPIQEPAISPDIQNRVKGSVNVCKCSEKLFAMDAVGCKKCRVIEVLPGSLLTNELTMDIDFDTNSGIDTDRDIIKVAVLERHNSTSHVGLGFLHGMGLKSGALASTVSHDSHNIIVIGSNDADMAVCVNEIIDMQGGLVVVDNGKVLSRLPLPVAGLMSMEDARSVANQNDALHEAVKKLGCNDGIEPFMNTAFLSLSVIPSLKITSRGLLNVNTQTIVPLLVQ